MPTKQGRTRPRAGHGLASNMTSDRTVTKRGSAKPARNRNRVASAKPAPVARRPR